MILTDATEEKVVDVLKLKDEGNAAFKAGHYDEAVEKYSECIKEDPSNGVFYSNRAFAYIKLEQYGAAIADANAGIKCNYPKAYYRRGTAYAALGKSANALKDFKLIVKTFPNDKDARKKFKVCKDQVTRDRFLKAIQTDQTKPLHETIEVSRIDVPSSYDGVKLPEKLTLESVKEMIEAFRKEKTIANRFAYQIVLDMLRLLKTLPSLVDIEIPEGKHFTVCGDVHGQFYDFLNIFEINGFPSEDNPYLFNGDFVDRGSFSAECVLSLFALKLLYPKHMHLTRGNHESITMNQMYGFKGEITSKYDARLFDLFTEAFQFLPLAACLGGKVLIVHGGLFSKDGVTLDNIRKIDRNRQPPDSGLMCELLWSDPGPLNGRFPSKRGVGVAFGPDVTKKFLDDNNLDLLVRSHEVKQNGYHTECDGRLITVFSAPNYCDQMGNKGAYIRFDHNYKPTCKSFTHVPHPNVKPMRYAMNMFGL